MESLRRYVALAAKYGSDSGLTALRDCDDLQKRTAILDGKTIWDKVPVMLAQTLTWFDIAPSMPDLSA